TAQGDEVLLAGALAAPIEARLRRGRDELEASARREARELREDGDATTGDLGVAHHEDDGALGAEGGRHRLEHRADLTLPAPRAVLPSERAPRAELVVPERAIVEAEPR